MNKKTLNKYHSLFEYMRKEQTISVRTYTKFLNFLVDVTNYEEFQFVIRKQNKGVTK